MVGRDGSYCECWESLLPKRSKASIDAYAVGENIERASERLWAVEATLSKAQFHEKCSSYGLQKYEIELVYDRYFEGLTFREIVVKSGWVSIDRAAYAFKNVLKRLRKRGFRIG